MPQLSVALTERPAKVTAAGRSRPIRTVAIARATPGPGVPFAPEGHHTGARTQVANALLLGQGRHIGSRPLSPTARSSSGASSATGTTGPKRPPPRFGSSAAMSRKPWAASRAAGSGA